MKRFLLSLLVIVLALGLLGAAAFAGYRYGFAEGMLVSSNGNSQTVRPGLRANPFGMPMHNFGLKRGFDFDGRGGMMRRGSGFGFGLFPLFGFGFGLLARLLFWGLIIAGIVWLVTRSGWRLTRTTPVVTTPPVVSTPSVENPPAAAPEKNQEP